jgi:hypothetical protein
MKKEKKKEKDKTKQRTLFYRRVVWPGKNSNNLEKLLVSAHQILTTTKKRTFPYNEVEIQGMKIKHDRDVGFFCHVASYVPGQSTSLVPSPADVKETDPLPQAPPNRHNFMEGDIFFLVNGDHIVLCPSGVRESIAVAYISNILQNSFNEGTVPIYSIEPIADVNKVNLLRQEGVKKIAMNASLYDASVDYIERKTVQGKIFSTAAKEILALFSLDNDLELREIDKKENLTVRVEISFDSRKKGGEIGKRRIESVANKIINDSDDGGDGFSIITTTGKRLTLDEVRLSEKATIAILGNSISRLDAWELLEQYMYSLKIKGMLEQ